MTSLDLINRTEGPRLRRRGDGGEETEGEKVDLRRD